MKRVSLFSLSLLLLSTAAFAVPPTFTDPTTGMPFVLVPGGCFSMGDFLGVGDKGELPLHKVCLSSFYMGQYEVTQAEWQKITGDNPSHFGPGPRYPVDSVSWNDITERFLPQLNRRSGVRYRLPTEAEWEYAAREGGKEVLFGNGKDVAEESGINFDAEEDFKESYSRAGQRSNSTVQVGSYTPNALQLCDMSGNLWEWCSDWYGEQACNNTTETDPTGPTSGEMRVFRGGSWYNGPWNQRTTGRFRDKPDEQSNIHGFRLALSVADVEAQVEAQQKQTEAPQ